MLASSFPSYATPYRNRVVSSSLQQELDADQEKMEKHERQDFCTSECKNTCLQNMVEDADEEALFQRGTSASMPGAWVDIPGPMIPMPGPVQGPLPMVPPL